MPNPSTLKAQQAKFDAMTPYEQQRFVAANALVVTGLDAMMDGSAPHASFSDYVESELRMATSMLSFYLALLPADVRDTIARNVASAACDTADIQGGKLGLLLQHMALDSLDTTTSKAN